MQPVAETAWPAGIWRPAAAGSAIRKGATGALTLMAKPSAFPAMTPPAENALTHFAVIFASVGISLINWGDVKNVMIKIAIFAMEHTFVRSASETGSSRMEFALLAIKAGASEALTAFVISAQSTVISVYPKPGARSVS